MQTLRGMGSAVGEYMGGGHGESSTADTQPTSVDIDVDDAEPELDDQVENDEGVSSENANPLLIFYDCETTGFSIYNDHITDVAAKIVSPPVPVEQHPAAYHQLVKNTLYNCIVHLQLHIY